MALDQQAVADDRDRRPDRQLAVELDGDRVHRDGADRPPRLAVDEHLGAGHVAPEAVRVAHGDDPGPRRPLGDEPPAVAGALSRLEEAHLREPAPPRERRPQPVLGRIGVERRDPVERDPAAGGVEAGVGESQRGRAVRNVAGEVRVRLGRLAEALDLLRRERRVRVGGREMAHQPDHVRRRLRQLGEPPASHARVELQVHRDLVRDLAVDRRRRARAAPRAPRRARRSGT